MKHHIGTSGWQYPHWKGIFYPQDLPTTHWLKFYSGRFRTLEINVTFYRDVKPATFGKWYDTVPDNFLFSVKMSRFITHIKRLKVERSSLDRFYSGPSALKEKLGVILIQLPPGLKFDAVLVRDFLDMLDDRFRYTIEARNKTFIDDNFFALLSEKQIAWCISDTAGRYPYREAITAPFVYIRLHGSQDLYASEYTVDELNAWASKVRQWDREAFVYFDNDFQGHAAKNAAMLRQLLDNNTGNL